MRKVWLAGFALLLSGCFSSTLHSAEPPTSAWDALSQAPVSSDVAQLPEWQNDTHAEALTAFRHSCRAVLSLPKNTNIKPAIIGGKAHDWHPACRAAIQLPASASNHTARQFFEAHFTALSPHRLQQALAHTHLANIDKEGLFTGYYVIAVQGSHTHTDRYSIPLYGMPSDSTALHHDRAAINAGALQGKAPILAWLDDPVARFFLQVQGSGIVHFPDGSTKAIGFAGRNTHPYTSIGKVLIERGDISRQNMSAPALRTWLQTHPEEAAELLNKNPSFIFMKWLDDGEIRGAQGVPLTPERSLAVDRDYIPLSAPIWLQTTTPAIPGGADEAPFTRLMIAQDTGSAIKGVVRGDVFWGSGDYAEQMAGYMKSPGTYTILLPHAVAKRLP